MSKILFNMIMVLTGRQTSTRVAGGPHGTRPLWPAARTSGGTGAECA